MGPTGRSARAIAERSRMRKNEAVERMGRVVPEVARCNKRQGMPYETGQAKPRMYVRGYDVDKEKTCEPVTFDGVRR